MFTWCVPSTYLMIVQLEQWDIVLFVSRGRWHTYFVATATIRSFIVHFAIIYIYTLLTIYTMLSVLENNFSLRRRYNLVLRATLVLYPCRPGGDIYVNRTHPTGNVPGKISGTLVYYYMNNAPTWYSNKIHIYNMKIKASSLYEYSCI